MITYAQQKIDYCSRDDTLSIKLCSTNKRQNADKKLNELYNVKINSLKNEVAINNLRSAQRAWIKFRNKDCEYQASVTKGGTIHSVIISECKHFHTKQRINEIKSFIKCTGGGCPW